MAKDIIIRKSKVMDYMQRIVRTKTPIYSENCNSIMNVLSKLLSQNKNTIGTDTMLDNSLSKNGITSSQILKRNTKIKSNNQTSKITSPHNKEVNKEIYQRIYDLGE